MIRLLPPLIITREKVDKVCDVLRRPTAWFPARMPRLPAPGRREFESLIFSQRPESVSNYVSSMGAFTRALLEAYPDVPYAGDSPASLEALLLARHWAAAADVAERVADVVRRSEWPILKPRLICIRRLRCRRWRPSL